MKKFTVLVPHNSLISRQCLLKEVIENMADIT